MKKIKLLLAIISVALLSSCLNIEEKVVVNADNSGAYSLSIDMGKVLATLQQMNPGDTSAQNKKIDTVVALKGFIDTARNLTVEEKALYRNASLAVKADVSNSVMKIKLLCPFTGIADLALIKKNLFTVIGKLDIADKTAGENLPKGVSLPAGANINAIAQTGNPIARFFTFAAMPGKISYTINDRDGLNKELSSDTLSQMKQMSMLMSDFSYNTIFVLPRAVKKISGPGSVLSADKKTVTFKRNFDDLTDKAENLEYKIEY